jgi:hypothetical protein
MVFEMAEQAVFRRAELFGQCIEASPSNPKHLDPGSLRVIADLALPDTQMPLPR